MQVTAIATPKITFDSAGSGPACLFAVLDAALPQLQEGDIVAVTSKIVSICEGAVLPLAEHDKEELAVQQSKLYLPQELSKYGNHFTITDNTLISMAGIDESNGDGYYVLWPSDAQKSANDIRKHLAAKHGVQHIGVVITDSTCMPLRRGTAGIFIAHSGFAALRNYIGQPDLFGEPLHVTQANIAWGIAAAAVLAMGEGAEQTPLALLREVLNVEYQERDPSEAELAEVYPTLEDDLFAPFLQAVPWNRGKKAKT